MRLTFILPTATSVPVGGFRIVYEYADRLAGRGHDVVIYHQLHPPPIGRLDPIRRLLKLDRPKVGKNIAPWFCFQDRVNLRMVNTVQEPEIQEGDVVFATGWETAESVSRLPSSRGSKFYLIQHDERLWSDSGPVRETWQLPMQKIVVATWLKDLIAAETGELATVIENATDFGAFAIDRPLERRRPVVGFLCHDQWEFKGTADALAALEIVRTEYRECHVLAFGTGPRPRGLPDYCSYHRDPSPMALRTIYNQCSIFVQASWSEGWGLTATEAMACGCALVSSDNGGSRDYAFHEETALVTAPRNPIKLAAAILRLLEDDGLRVRLARNGSHFVRRFTWQRSVDAFETILKAK